MSNHLAIATVSATLGQLALASAEQAVSGVTLHFGRPTVASNVSEKRLYVYLFQVSPNAALRNGDLPTRGASTQLVGRPRAALDLHYLLVFAGDDRALEPQRMLGAVARDLHARPILTRSAIDNTVASTPELAGSDLAQSVESVKLTPVALPLEELSKLWSVLIQTPHMLAAMYNANVVVLDALEAGAEALPVLKRGQADRGVDAQLGSYPRLERVWLGPLAAASVRPIPPSQPSVSLGMRVTVSGENLAGERARLRFVHDGMPAVELDAGVANSGRELTLDLPDDNAAASAWAAGVYRVSALITRGSQTRATNVLPLALAPRITTLAPNPAPRDSAGNVTLSVRCRPQVRPGQVVELMLGDREVRASAFAVATDTVSFTIVDAPVLNAVLARLRVDGAESLPVRFDPATRGFAFDDTQRVTIS